MRQINIKRQNESIVSNSQQRRIKSNPLEKYERKSQTSNYGFDKHTSNIFNPQQMKQIHLNQMYASHYQDNISQDQQTSDEKKTEPIDFQYILRKGEIYFMYGSFLIYSLGFLLLIFLVFGIYKIYLNTSSNYCDDDTNFMYICKLSNGFADTNSNQSYIIQILLFICLTISQVIRLKFGIYDLFEISANKYLIYQIKGEKSPTSYTVKISNIKAEDNLEENILLYFDLIQKPRRVKIRCITFCYDIKIIDKLTKIKFKAQQKSEVNFLQQRLAQKIISRQEKEIKSQDLFNGIAYITFDSIEEKQLVIQYQKKIISKFSELWQTEGEYLQKYRKLKQQIESQDGKTFYQPSEWYEGITISEPEQPTDIIWGNQHIHISKLRMLWIKIFAVICTGIFINFLSIFFLSKIQLTSLNSFRNSGSNSSKALFIILSIVIPLITQIINKFIRFLVYGGFKQIFTQKSTISLIYIIVLPIILSLNEVMYLVILSDRICEMQIEWMNMFINLLYPIIHTMRMFNTRYNINISNLIFGNQSSYIQFYNKVTKDKNKKQIKINKQYVFVIKIFYNTIAICESNPLSIIFYFATIFLTIYIQKMLLKSNNLKQNFCSSDLCRFQDLQFSIGLLVISITQISRLQIDNSLNFKIQLAINILTVVSTLINTLITLYKYIQNKRNQIKKDQRNQNYLSELELSSVKSKITQQNDQKNSAIQDIELKYSYFQLNPVNLYMAEQRKFSVQLLNQKQLELEGRLSLTNTQEILIKLFNQICDDYFDISKRGKDEMYRQPDKKNNKVSKQFSEFELKSFFIEDSILNLINLYLEISKNNISIKKQTVFLNSQLSSQLLGKFNKNIF
ncbi:transmembrane protein, putative (macronuclear) [Tetrahymena thermophila SB210]|uniref:Transmembrane protein, putative n=1 Tax=Tetrahymena thermophila (strain SB210) TaxID=312017 RepID=I7M8Y4_TETTS|nr:transmembrane protein, putative [Tetrahymena thermophila SB210]EAS00285.2 transmembrane protein, putative [Tetrahymena thermophila SB210]|eukprot:XP_001020530.2 transmembrane protein, putative [Tetrahymena thermophila SB210]